MDQIKFTPTKRRTVDHMTPLGATAALYLQGNQRRATLPSQQPIPSMAARTWPLPCSWSPPYLALTTTRSHPCLPQMRHWPWAPIPAPKASWAWGRASCSATRARASAMKNNRLPALLALPTAWRLSYVWSRPPQVIWLLSSQQLCPFQPSPLQPHPPPPLLLSLCPPRSPQWSPSSGPPARKVPAEKQEPAQAEGGVR